jgi:hypothetical protein
LIPVQSETTANRDKTETVTGLFDSAYFELGISIGDTHTLEIYYLSGDIINLEPGSKMYYNVTDIAPDTCTFSETVNYANGSLAYENNYTDSRADIQMPFFYTTINVTLLTETLDSSEYTITADSNFITIVQYSNNSGDITDGVYIFHSNTGWLYSYVATMTFDGIVTMEIDMRDIYYVDETTTIITTTPETTTTQTYEDNTTTETPTSDGSDTESNSTKSIDDSATTTTTTIPNISPSSGLLSLIVIGTLSVLYRRRKK